MGRTATFDRASVVRAARDVFWDRGWAETGVAELEAATGLMRSSLYHAFGSKKGVFEAVVAEYLDDVVRTRLTPLRAPDAAPSALADYLAEMRAALLSGSARSRSGCLLLNAACAPVVDDDPDVRGLVNAYTAELRVGVAAGVARARADLGPEASAALAEVVSSLVIAALALARTDPDAAIRSLDAADSAARSWS
ncbi:TetR/AcrR family transcriptional regulator [Microbacterium sp. NPDC091313]